MNRLYIPAVEPPDQPSSVRWWLAFRGDQLLVREAGETADVPRGANLEDIGLTSVRRHYLGTLGDDDAYVVEVADDAAVPAGVIPYGLRALYERLPDDLFALAGRAVQILTWDRNHQFCGHCATPTVPIAGERARRCPNCHLSAYPRVSPAIIVLVTRGDQLLLTRGHQFPAGRFGVLAGFVEAGESLEEALVREVNEEVGIEVSNIRYFGSQPWPYPHQIMVGFTAEWAAGEIRVDPHELAEAGWFSADTLPNIPPKLSIARRLIDAFLTTLAEQRPAERR